MAVTQRDSSATRNARSHGQHTLCANGDLMTQKTLVILGAGPGLGRGIARAFGRRGFRVALISRDQAKMNSLASALAAEGIEAAGFAADVTKPETVSRALGEVRQRFGPIDVLEFSPLPPIAEAKLLSAAGATPDIARAQFEFQAIGAMNAVREVLPEMRARKSGTILLTVGGSAHRPMPFITPISMGMSACRTYGLSLNVELAPEGIFVGVVAIGAIIKEGDSFGDPGKLAETYYQLYEQRDRADVFLLDPASEARLKTMVDSGASTHT